MLRGRGSDRTVVVEVPGSRWSWFLVGRNLLLVAGCACIVTCDMPAMLAWRSVWRPQPGATAVAAVGSIRPGLSVTVRTSVRHHAKFEGATCSSHGLGTLGLVLALVIAVWALARQVGVCLSAYHDCALMIDAGPKVGSARRGLI